jgi:integrase
MFTRAGELLGANWSLHDLRHTAAYRMARDPEMPITDVQWVLGHVHLSTTQIYVTPTAEDVIASVAGHYRRQAEQPVPPPPAGPGYRPESLDVLFGRRG